jgi:tRNA threonylcarbamoyladenosine biosynthesis protein TsaE
MIIDSYKTEDTFRLGFSLGADAKKGEIYCLNGDLGVGKTVFTQGFAKGLGIEEAVSSPTFTIIQQYEGKLPDVILSGLEQMSDDELAVMLEQNPQLLDMIQ